MAELDVQPKKKSPWWLWLLIALIVLALIFFFLSRNDDDRVEEREIDDEPETGSVYSPAPSSYAFQANTVHLYSRKTA